MKRTSFPGRNTPFKHALTHEVAYESLLMTAVRHCMPPGRRWRRFVCQRLEDAYERLAYHYARTDNVAKAVAYLTRVAEKAVRHSAHMEAISHLTQALELLQRLPPRRNATSKNCRCVLPGASLIATKGYAAPEVSTDLHPRSAALSAPGHPNGFSRCCADCGVIISHAPSCKTAHALGEQL